MTRYQLLVEYVGTDFRGWQIQKKGSTIQGLIQKKLTKLLKEKIILNGSGRTDTGVHASDYYAHFDLLDCKSKITNENVSVPSFTHMKPRIQNWSNDVLDRWQDRVGTYLSEDLQLKIGNYKQSGIFHYTEGDFVNDRIIDLYEKSLGIC